MEAPHARAAGGQLKGFLYHFKSCRKTVLVVTAVPPARTRPSLTRDSCTGGSAQTDHVYNVLRNQVPSGTERQLKCLLPFSFHAWRQVLHGETVHSIPLLQVPNVRGAIPGSEAGAARGLGCASYGECSAFLLGFIHKLRSSL